jgi:HK97 family phage major capsid protein
MSEAIMKAIDGLESKISAYSEKAQGELATVGKTAVETKQALDALGKEQLVIAQKLMELEQKQSARKDDEGNKILSPGEQFTKAEAYKSYSANGARGRARIEVKNTVTNAIGNTFSERRPGIVEGAFRVFTIEDLIASVPTSANAVDWIRENVFTNNAAEVAEGAAKPQSDLTTSVGTMPISTVAHLIKITRQLAMDNAALAAYINRRMVYGVNLRVEQQLIAGNGVAPNLGGLTLAANRTAHGYTAASLTGLGLLNNRFDLIGKMIGDAALADYPADAILVNTADWWTMRLSKDSQGRYLLGDPGSTAAPSLFGLPVVASNAMLSDNVLVGSFMQAATIHNREGVVVDMFDQDENNAQLNLVTIRAERRLALTVEKPAAMRYGDLTPA